MKDEDKQLTFNQVLQPKYDKQFVQSKQVAPNFGNEQLSVWNKFTVINRSSREWTLVELNPVVDTLKFYYKDSLGVYREIISGESRSLSTRKYKVNFFIFDLPVRRNDSAIFYLKVQTFKAEYPLVLFSKASLVQDIYIDSLIKGIYLGIVFLIIIYNATLYFAIKDHNYLYYIFYAVFTALLMTEQSGVVTLFRGDAFHFLWNYGPALTATSGIFFFIFSRSFLMLKVTAPKTAATVKYFFIPVYLFVIALNLLNKQLIGSILVQIVGIIVLITMMTTAVTIYKKGYKPARFYILACGSYFLGIVFYIGKSMAILPYNYFTTNAMEVGSALEMIMFSVSMADRVNIFRKEKAKAQKELVLSLEENHRLVTEQNKLLEIKVEERTHQLTQTLEQLEHANEQLEHKNEIISGEKEKSDHLLLNILPYETAQELKDKGTAAAKMYNDVTVMFTDFQDFTVISETMSPSELVEELDYCFRAFDSIIDKYKIEKIKTIGDSYMAAGGLPVPDKESPCMVVKAAIEIQQFMKQHNEQRTKANKEPLEVRIGIHTGQVVAGIVGTKKFAYDIWGDTVNTASRMESCGKPGKVNISETTYDFVKHEFECLYRGKVAAKNKGMIDMYFVESYQPQAAAV